jgi:CubicO group peptidase (beta-lactamase class C family)
MRGQIIKFIYITGCLFFTACSTQGKPKEQPEPAPETPPQFGKVNIDLSDTNAAAFKSMIYRLDTFYKRQVAAGFNGSVLVGYRGQILYERYFGYSQKESGAMWNDDTRSQLASTSKTLTSAAILLLRDKGLLNIDDPVSKYLKSFPYEGISVRMLLNHRSGLPDYIKFAAKPANKLYLNNDDVVQLFATKKPKLLFTPNTAFKYSNSNYALLASVVESVSGMKFAYFMKRFIFQPLRMDCTFVLEPEEEKQCTAAFCYNAKWIMEPDMHLDGVAGDKGIYSSVRDLYRWDQALYTNKLLKYSTIEEAFKPYSFEQPGVKNYGLGWRMLNYADGTKIVFHNGWWHGNNTCFFRFIQDNFTIIVLGNKYNRNIYRQPQQIYQLVMNTKDSVKTFETEE